MTISHVEAYERGRMAIKKLTAKQLDGLIISVGEARKLLGASANNLTDMQVALEVLTLTEYAINITKYQKLQEKAL